MKGKPDIKNFLEGGAAAAAEQPSQAAPAPSDIGKITKTIRLSKVMEGRLKEEAFKRSVAAGKRVTESDLIENALNNYLNK